MATKQKDAPKVNPLDGLFTTPAPMNDTHTQDLPVREGAAAQPAPTVNAILANPTRPRKDKRLNLVLPTALVEEMRAFCTKYGLSLNEGTARAYRFFIDNAEGRH